MQIRRFEQLIAWQRARELTKNVYLLTANQFLVIAKGSCAEVRSQLYVALDTGYITNDQFEKARAQAEEVGRIVGGLRASLKRGT